MANATQVTLVNGVPTAPSGTVSTLDALMADGGQATLGSTTGAAVVTNAAGTIQGYLRGIVSLLVSGITVSTHAVTQSGSWVLSAGSALIGVVKVGDGTNTAAIKAASTAATTADAALVVAISPNSQNANGQALMAASSPVSIASDQSTISVSADTAKIMNGATGVSLTPQFASIVASASGATTILASTAGKKIRVLQWIVKTNAAVNFKFQSHVTPTDETGLLYCGGQGDGAGGAFSPIGHFQTIAGEALDINLSSAVAVGGYLVYVLV